MIFIQVQTGTGCSKTSSIREYCVGNKTATFICAFLCLCMYIIDCVNVLNVAHLMSQHANKYDVKY